ncbi:citrate synthase [Leptospira gomenensis]|uniref:citrate synthase (unknown stereospecificity) n=1 Tax=Leptospira gomenensis TaxID=2484974 RepID=A0A5F1YI33_9LEPT|nr:citrate synthase family protein [Leptospira gomenensis]TGK37432.1 citrate synthase [Leptospira gomenensis]TGK40791.1 citrate synthase [Leptospira gomenensis]TGK43017.1 citrate synthase [Leptospira gomenensis]TGK54283.1 citrate synthase [Leptospira gomenensis]
MKNEQKKPFLSALETAQELGVEVETVYAYVSRGILRSESSGSKDRTKRYRREEVERLLIQREEKLNPGRTAKAALTFGQPVLESSISMIENSSLYYRGQNAETLSETSRFESVCDLLWENEGVSAFDSEWPVWDGSSLYCYAELKDRPLIDLCRILLGVSEYLDPISFLRTQDALRKTGVRIVRLLALFASGSKPKGNRSISEILWYSWKEEAVKGKRSVPIELKKNVQPNQEDKKAIRLIEAALILSADHELNVSAFTARCVASSDASLYQAVIAALGALSGNRHGLLTEKTIELLAELDPKRKDPKSLLVEKLKRGETIPGFGHPFYKDGDPRAKKLTELTESLFPKNREFLSAKVLIEEAVRLLGDYPTIDAGLALVCRTLKLPKGAGLALFAIGRCAGWIAHSMEQYASDRLIRPRARYVGILPGR